MAASRILVGYDGSPHAEDALALARALYAASDTEIALARVVPWEPLVLSAVPLPELRARYEEQERGALEELQQVADRHGVSAEAGPGDSPARGLHDLAEELDPQLVVVGSSHRGKVGQVLAGNVALRLLNGLDRQLAVAPAGYAQQPSTVRRIGVGFDGSPESSEALTAAGRIAGPLGAEVEVIAAVAPNVEVMPHPWAFAWVAGTGRDDLDERTQQRLESAAGSLPHGVRRATRFVSGTPAAVLLGASDELDLLVLGSRGYGPARRLLLGSVSARLVQESRCPVLVTPGPPAREPEPLGEPVRGATPA